MVFMGRGLGLGCGVVLGGWVGGQAKEPASQCARVRVDFGKGIRTATFQFSESNGSLNGPDLFPELPFLQRSLPNPSFTECLRGKSASERVSEKVSERVFRGCQRSSKVLRGF